MTALLQKKIEEINSRQSDYRGRLEDYHHVRCQVTDFTSRGYNINEQVARIKQVCNIIKCVCDVIDAFVGKRDVEGDAGSKTRSL